MSKRVHAALLAVLVLLMAMPWARRASAAPMTITIKNPATAGARFGPDIAITAKVASTYEVSSLVASVGSANAPLTFDSLSNVWAGTLPLTSVGFGPKTLTLSG